MNAFLFLNDEIFAKSQIYIGYLFDFDERT